MNTHQACGCEQLSREEIRQRYPEIEQLERLMLRFLEIGASERNHLIIAHIAYVYSVALASFCSLTGINENDAVEAFRDVVREYAETLKQRKAEWSGARTP